MLGSDWTVENHGIGGQGLRTLSGDRVDSLFNWQRERSIVALLIGTNDILLPPFRTGAELWAMYVEWCTARLAMGYEVVAVTLPEWDFNYWGKHDDWLTFNTSLRDGAASLGVRLADAADALGPFTGLGSWWVDGTHLNEAGYGKVAEVVFDAATAP